MAEIRKAFAGSSKSIQILPKFVNPPPPPPPQKKKKKKKENAFDNTRFLTRGFLSIRVQIMAKGK